MLGIITGFFKGIIERAALMFGAFRYGAMREKKKTAQEELKDAIKDLDIAAEPLKRGRDLTDSL